MQMQPLIGLIKSLSKIFKEQLLANKYHNKNVKVFFQYFLSTSIATQQIELLTAPFDGHTSRSMAFPRGRHTEIKVFMNIYGT